MSYTIEGLKKELPNKLNQNMKIFVDVEVGGYTTVRLQITDVLLYEDEDDENGGFIVLPVGSCIGGC